jgi:hypothetical protein
MAYDTNLTRRENFIRNIGVNVPDHVENEAAYVAHAVAKIAGNWERGNRARWEKAHADAPRIRDWLFNTGEFEGSWADNGRWIPHPQGRGRGVGGFNDLIEKLAQDLRECGGLSDKQTEIVRKAMANQDRFNEERKAKFAEANARDAAISKHLGSVGERRNFELDIQWVKAFEGMYGTSYMHGMKDLGGNVVIYKGSNKLGEKGDRVMIKASIKEHGEREGVKQTVIARPKAL